MLQQQIEGFSLGLQPTTSFINRYPRLRLVNLKIIDDFQLINAGLKIVQIQDGFNKFFAEIKKLSSIDKHKIFISTSTPCWVKRR